MSYGFLDVAVTPAVRAVQEQLGVDHMWRDKGKRAFDRFTGNEAGFIAARDSFYMASTSETGWPYLQHRGGPPGFLRVLGNLSASDEACLILIDYPHRARLKIYAHAEAVPLDADPALTAAVLDGTSGRAKRIIRLRLESFDWSCPQHIVPRYTETELADALAPIRARLATLEAENAALRAEAAG